MFKKNVVLKKNFGTNIVDFFLEEFMGVQLKMSNHIS